MKIGIRGHESRGKEVIQILESLGGKNNALFKGSTDFYYSINSEGYIINDYEFVFARAGFKIYTLEEFEKEFPFKIGDKVTIIGLPYFPKVITQMVWDCGEILYSFEDLNNTWFGAKSLKKFEMKEERNITLTLDKAKEWYKKGGELKEVALQAYSEEELNPLPRSWEEFATNHARRGYYISADGKPLMCASSGKLSSPHVCSSKESAEAHLAMIQLEQLRNRWWNGWKPIWDCSEKWCIGLWGNELSIGIITNASKFLTFPTKEMAEEFLKCFRDLIEKAGDLI